MAPNNESTGTETGAANAPVVPAPFKDETELFSRDVNDQSTESMKKSPLWGQLSHSLSIAHEVLFAVTSALKSAQLCDANHPRINAVRIRRKILRCLVTVTQPLEYALDVKLTVQRKAVRSILRRLQYDDRL